MFRHRENGEESRILKYEDVREVAAPPTVRR
jgi:hypothetical protein